MNMNSHLAKFSLTNGAVPQHPSRVGRAGPVMVTAFSQESRVLDKSIVRRQIQAQVRKSSWGQDQVQQK